MRSAQAAVQQTAPAAQAASKRPAREFEKQQDRGAFYTFILRLAFRADDGAAAFPLLGAEACGDAALWRLRGRIEFRPCGTPWPVSPS